jgi:hypothetical protein
MITLDDIELPGQMFWSDELWSPVAQSEEYSTTGALLLDESEKQAGRPITLGGRDYTCWVTRATVDALLAKAAIKGQVMTLTLEDARTFQVRFRYENGKAIEATPIYDRVPPQPEDDYTLTVKLIAVG